MSDDLIERLRRKADAEEDNYLHGGGTNIFFPLLDEAADALAAKDTAISERDATIARQEKLVAAFRNDGLVQASLARQGALQDERDEAVEALSEMRAERDDAIATVRLLQDQHKRQSDHDTAIIAAAEAQLERARKALAKIEKWFGEFPETGEFWRNTDGTISDRPMSYAGCYGSNGERDYMRSVARRALSQGEPADLGVGG